MSALSTRVGLIMPDPSETVSITDLNNNTEAIDNGLGMLLCTSGTRPSSPFGGQLIYETDTHRRYFWDTSGPVGVWHLVGTATVMVTQQLVKLSDTSLENVPELAIPLAPNTSYVFDSYIAYSSDAAADAQLGISLPSGSTMLISGYQLAFDSATFKLGTLTAGPVSLGGSGVGVGLAALPRGSITTGATAGDVQLSFAQLVSTASNTILLAGSWMSIRRV